ncbi:MAG: hypothetical protein R3Y63_08750 [Eubacteriales bacterium]
MKQTFSQALEYVVDEITTEEGEIHIDIVTQAQIEFEKTSHKKESMDMDFLLMLSKTIEEKALCYHLHGVHPLTAIGEAV